MNTNYIPSEDGLVTIRKLFLWRRDIMPNQGQSFPALPRFQPEGGEWMTSEQETVTNIYVNLWHLYDGSELVPEHIQRLDEELFDWQDPDKPFSFYDLTHDAEELLGSIHITREDMKDVFSRISHWPPAEEQYVEEASTKNGGFH
eukprot:scaffold50543_cov47-Attheya_sp.AAC.1